MTPDLSIQSDFSLLAHNTFGINARASRYLALTSVEMLHQANTSGVLDGMPHLVLGGGSNILLTDDFPGIVLHMSNRGIAQIGADHEASYVRAAAGECWHALVQWTLAQGLGGLENLSLIPGSVGAAPIQNIGAYGAELKDCFHSLRAYDLASGVVHTLARDACEFAYRDSVFKHRLRDKMVILDITLALPKRWQPNLRYADLVQELAARRVASPSAQEISDAVIAIRQRKLPDPAVIGNAGSFFKNPVVSADKRDALLAAHAQLVSYAQTDGSYKLAAGWLIEQTGWKGKCLGAAGVYARQALVLVNRGGASGGDIVRLAQAIIDDVAERFGVRLEPEPVFV